MDVAGTKQMVAYTGTVPWGDGTALPTAAGQYYLTTNVAISATWEITEKNIDLDLNGHSITMTGDQTVIAVNDATFTLYDCIGTGKITGGKGSTGTDSSNGGGVAVGNNTGKSGADTFIMYGGSICQNSALGYGGGVMVFSSSSGGAKSFLMRGGTIEDNTAGTEAAGKCGGGVCIENGTFECCGTIQNNRAPGISSNNSGGDGGVYFAGGTFHLLGTIRDNVAAGSGGGIYINGGSVKVCRYPEAVGTICGNSASRNYGGGGGGAGICVSSGTLDVDGLIEENHSDNDGGGIYVSTSGILNCSSEGVIRNNTAEDGGGIGVNAYYGSVTINGTIEGNSASGGGGVFISRGPVKIGSSGKIRNNTATVYGGGIYYNGGTLTCAGVIKGNKAQSAGGIFIMNNTGNVFTLTGKIEENIANNGGGVMFYGTSVLNVSGSASIQNNKQSESSDVFSDLSLSGDQKVTVTGALNDDARIGIDHGSTPSGGPIVCTSGYEANNPGLTQPKHFFVSGSRKYSVKLQGGEAALDYITVTFDANGGNCSTSSAQASYSNGRVNSLPTASRTEYTHAGWYTAATGGDKITTSTVFSSDTTVYAHWTPKEYTITYSLDGGSLSGEKTSYTIETETFTLPQPAKPGYRFDGWSGTGIAAGTKEKTVTVVKGSTGGRSYTAHYTAAEYTVTFDADGGSVTPGSKTVTYGTVYGDLPTPVRDGYRFDGWFTARTGGTQIAADTTVSVTDDITAYAHWTLIEYAISYVLDGGAMSGEKTSYNIETETFTLPQPAKTGYLFAGWSGTGIAAGTKEKTVTIAKGSTGGRSYTAHYTVAEYTVTFDADGGSVTPGSKTVTYGAAYGDLPTPVRDGYRFDGWFTAKTGGTQVLAETVAAVVADQTLYAVWTKTDAQILTEAKAAVSSFDGVSVSWGEDSPNIKPATINEPGAVFGTIVLKKGSETLEMSVSVAIDMLTGNKLILAHAASGDGRTVYHAGEVVTVQAAATPEGKCAFEGWNVSGITVGAEQLTKKTLTFSMPENDVTVTAVYKDHSPAKGVAVQPDCVHTGLTAGAYCSVCRIVLEAQEEVPALGHDFDCEWTVIREATEQEEGLRGKVCQNGCGRKQYADIPKKGSTSDSGNVSKYVEAAPDAPETVIGTDKESLTDKLLTAEEKNAVESGTNASIWLEVSKAAPTEDEEKKIFECAAAALGEGVSVSCVDVNLFKRVGDSSEVQIHEPGMNVTVTVIVPENMLNRDAKLTRQYGIIRLHGGKADEVSSSYNEKTHEITFATDKFSVYAIAYLDKPVNGDQEDTGENNAGSQAEESNAGSNTGSQAAESNAGSGNVTGSGAEDNPLDKVPKTGRLVLFGRWR